MALTKVTGSVIKDSVSLSGNVSVGGTLTYQDVTNVDAIGIGTFRSGINVSAGQVDIGSNIKLGNAGVITATSFSGSGANLTSLPAQATIANNADNRVITGGSGVNLNGEANLTFDGSNVIHAGSDGRRYSFAGGGSSHYMKFDSTLNGIILNGYGGIAFETNGTNERLRIDSSGNVNFGSVKAVALPSGTGIQVYNSSTPRIKLVNDTTGNAAGDGLQIYMSGSSAIFDQKENAEMRFYTNATEKLRIASNGHVGINQLSPDRLLEVSNDNAPAAKFGGTGGGQDFAIEIGQLTSSSSPGFNATGGSAMLFKNNGTESMRLISAGNGGGVGVGTANSGNAKSLNVYTTGSNDGKYAMQIENGYGSSGGGNILKLKTARGDVTVDVDLIRMDLNDNTRIFSVDNSGLMRFRSGCGSGSQDALAVYGVRAWINFNSTSGNAIRGKGGLSGVTDRGVGQHTYNFSTNMPDGNYTVTCNSGNSGGGTSNRNRMSAYSLTTSNFRIDDYDSGAGSTPAHTDRQMVHVMVVR